MILCATSVFSVPPWLLFRPTHRLLAGSSKVGTSKWNLSVAATKQDNLVVASHTSDLLPTDSSQILSLKEVRADAGRCV